MTPAKKTIILTLLLWIGGIGQLTLNAEEHIWVEENKSINFIKQEKIKVLYNDGEIEDIYAEPKSKIILTFKCQSGKGYEVSFALKPEGDEWDIVEERKEKDWSNLIILKPNEECKYSIQEATENGKSATIILPELDESEKTFTFKDGENGILTIHVKKKPLEDSITFSGLLWYLEKKQDNQYIYNYNKDGKLDSIANSSNLKLSINKKDTLHGGIIPLAHFNLKNNSSKDSIQWSMPENNNLSGTLIKIYKKTDQVDEDTIPPDTEQGYILGIKINSKIDTSSEFSFTLKTATWTSKKNTVPSIKFNFKEEQKEEGKGLASFFKNKWWYDLVIVGLLLLVFGRWFFRKKILAFFRINNDEENHSADDNAVDLESTQTKVGAAEDHKKSRETELKSDYRRKNKKELERLYQTLEQKNNLGNAYDIDKLVDIINGKTKLLPNYLKDKSQLNAYINDTDKANTLNSFLDTYDRAKSSYKLTDLLPTLTSRNQQINTLHTKLGLQQGNIESQINYINDIKHQYGKLESFDKLINIRPGNFAQISISKINELTRSIEEHQKAHLKELSEKDKLHQDIIKELNETHRNNAAALEDRVNRSEQELSVRLPGYISGTKLCVESIYSIYQRIKASATTQHKFIEEMVNPVLVGVNNTDGLKGFIDKLNNQGHLFKLLDINNWSELNEQDAQKKALFVEKAIYKNEFIAIIDLVTIFYAYSKIKIGSVNVERDLVELGINPTEISHAHGILQWLLKQLFDIEVMTPVLFNDKFNETKHQLNTVRRFITFNGDYRGLENTLEPKTIFDMLHVELKSNTYKFIDRKAQVIYK